MSSNVAIAAQKATATAATGNAEDPEEECTAVFVPKYQNAEKVALGESEDEENVLFSE